MKVLGKLLLSSVILAGSLSAIPLSATQAAAGKVSILLDGYALPFPVQPTVMKGTTMVPFRAISEALGIQVTWNQKEQKIIATKQSDGAAKQVVLTIGSKNALVDGQAAPLSIAPQTIQNSTMIPLSFFSQQFGAAVAWDQTTQTVSITSPQKDMYTMGFYALSSFDERAYIPSFDSISFGWSRIDTNGQFTVQGKEYKWPQAAGDVTPESIIQDAAQQGTSPYLMVYSVDSSLELTKNLEDTALQESTTSQIVATASEKGFKGIALDLEGLGLTGDKNKVKTEYNAFIKNLSTKARQAGLKLTLVLHPLNSSYSGYDYKILSSLADDLVIMAYAFEQEKGPEPLNKVDEAIRLALKETNKDKLILGISLGSENATSVNSKIGLAKRYDLKGVAFWRLGLIGQPAWAQINQSIEMK
ncbi:stalk domain-containing protein [Paenibacillus dokdonensis]|uniref:Stalk domain-containing protein n=1 Tax=Paenibacillus dokdonensis TaxID=2567944 RepID=A0ABU6GRW8_9BACL|nr:stalk domain-containing protein [Paenibacillus dokdonensis]MEC0242495.1 stalk domain-containing protein [Paenibacillus dokdonensis]